MSSNIRNLVADTAKHVEQIIENVNRAAGNAVVEGGSVMREMIETRGTLNTWSKTYYKNGIARSDSAPGRVWTGNMRDSVGSSHIRSGRGSFSSFGWIKGQDPYFLEQEKGFLHEEAGVAVAGMYALQDSREHAIASLKEELGKI